MKVEDQKIYLEEYYQTYYIFEQLMISRILEVSESTLTLKELVVLEKIKQLTKVDNNNPTSIAAETGFSKSALSNLLKRLENKKYIDKKTDLQDQRKFKVTITETSNKYLNSIDLFMDAFRNYFFKQTGILGMRHLLITAIHFSNTVSEFHIDFKFYKLNHYKDYFQQALSNLYISINKQEQIVCEKINEQLIVKDFIILQAIALEDKHTVVALSTVLKYQVHSLHKILKKLVHLGILTSEKSATDLRLVHYFLTDKGTEDLEKFIANRKYVLNMLNVVDQKGVLKKAFEITKTFLLLEKSNM